ncbi:hypothetical protein AB0A74_33945 [Saccharothrix sp. NPDC042600]|uniref:hypothetical protein n=1 Tax=Saccharothrix TaxID=2071 RepID=UPI0033D18A17|nr:hypothetical protein GCM10017745_14190 [Saccharothrix mutabilis subsp. capreolus]
MCGGRSERQCHGATPTGNDVRASPAGSVAAATASNARSPFAAGSRGDTRSNSAPSNVRTANITSSPEFQYAAPPATAPHIVNTPANRPALRSASTVAVAPPIDSPAETVRRGTPISRPDQSSNAIWSRNPSSIDHPTGCLNCDPASAYPRASR